MKESNRNEEEKKDEKRERKRTRLKRKEEGRNRQRPIHVAVQSEKAGRTRLREGYARVCADYRGLHTVRTATDAACRWRHRSISGIRTAVQSVEEYSV